MKKLIVTADDFGLTRGVSAAIIELLRAGVVSRTSVMVDAEGVQQDCEALALCGFAGRAGVHLILHHDDMACADIEADWERQIVCAFDLIGQKPSHLDSHKNVHLKEDITPIYLRLAAKYELPVRGGHRFGAVDGGAWNVNASAICDNRWSGKLLPLDTLKGFILERVSCDVDGVVEVVTHPGFCDDDLKKASSWNDLREHEYKALLALAEEQWFEKNGIELVIA